MKVQLEAEVLLPQVPKRLQMTTGSGIVDKITSEYDTDVLSWVCDEWRRMFFEQACREDPRKAASK